MDRRRLVIGQGRHGAVIAQPAPSDPAIWDRRSRPNASDTSQWGATPLGGLEGWQAVKIVSAPPDGRLRSMLPHDVGEEVKILKRLDHSNIVKLVDYHYETDLLEHYLHFPLFACTLTELFKDPSFPFEPPAVPLPQPSPLASFNVTTGLSYQLLTALGYLASSDVAHRDINPSNLLIDFCGNLKLVDFGTAWSGSSAVMMDNQGETVVRHDRSANGREQSQGDGEGVRARSSCDVGTGAYRAPELLFSPVKYNPYAVDSWAAGCVIAQMFRPFGSFDPHEFDDSGSDSDSDIRSDSEEGSDGWSDNTEDPDPLDEPWRRVRNSGGDGNGTGSRTGTTTGGDKGGMGERQPMFDASFGTLGLAASIFKIRGTPSLDTWPTFIQLPDAGKIGFPSSHPIPLTSPLILPHLQEGHDELMAAASKVIEGLLTLDPGRRLTAKKALESRWFEGVDNVLVQGVCRPWVDVGKKSLERKIQSV
ncbi:STE/STE11 protein kinase [Cryptococcus neoformans Tu259-1]|uniref:STE/STE11 protein kinase n=1 Tax=Cryptococcus neoformans Tu259-1 TaxID=1230072 RepID=A0A854QA94_CRYNE|nr:STE/STE11 protein kinase [Cryptococcus neoformans var. grubii 125.91]OXG17700.1 STE/STE11 protein kinase [Cryptococcus neoformans var. grubii Tu259-1]OXG77564.1 STE/STE11 protein kinase [Cryptococcus neoformans var. grubii MW-RSA36]OXL07230.1 STE/STE11 protein kinase [Cryptococcus neoformans var. grubii Gb118]